jgi:hypothetical protein
MLENKDKRNEPCGMSMTWNGRPMATGRSTSILDAAEAAMERCGAKTTPVGINPERVRILMRQQAIKFAHVTMPKSEIPERCRKVKQKHSRNKQREMVIAAWLTIPEDQRDFLAHAKRMNIIPATLSVYLRHHKLQAYPQALRERILKDHKEHGLDGILERLKISQPIIVTVLVNAGVNLRGSALTARASAVRD